LEKKLLTQKKIVKKLAREHIRLVKDVELWKRKYTLELMRKTKSHDDLLSIEDIELEYKIKRRTIDRWREKGLNPPVKSGKKNIVRIVRKDLEDYIKKNRDD